VTIDFILKNETKILKEKDTLITVKGEDIIKYQKIPVSNKERTFSITFKCEDKEKSFTIYQEELGIKLMKLSIQKKNELYLNVPEKIYSGLNSYNLRIEKDNFSKISVNFINPNFTTNIKENKIVAAEIMPGLMPKVIKKLSQKTHIPIITGGLIKEKEDVINAIKAGALSVSTTETSLWEE